MIVDGVFVDTPSNADYLMVDLTSSFLPAESFGPQRPSDHVAELRNPQSEFN